MLCRLLTHFSHLFIGSRSCAEPHSMNLHCVFSPKEGCCTWLSAFLPVSCRVQSQGEKLCRITCKFDKGGNKKRATGDKSSTNMDGFAVVGGGTGGQLSKGAVLKGSFPPFHWKIWVMFYHVFETMIQTNIIHMMGNGSVLRMHSTLSSERDRGEPGMPENVNAVVC